jgi:O-antigen/teichoic acid export membrane protein
MPEIKNVRALPVDRALASGTSVTPRPMVNRKETQLRSDLIWTASVQFGIMLSSLLVYGLIARIFAAKGVGEFALIRRALYFLQPITLLGITVAVPRFLPFHETKAARAQITAVGFSAVMFLSVVVSIGCVVERGWVATVLFGDRQAQLLAIAFAAMTVAFGFHSYSYCYFRGMRQMRSANTLDLVNSAVAPLVAVALAANFSVATAVLILSAVIFAWTSFQSKYLWSEIRTALTGDYSPHLTKSLLLYGLPRIPGDLALAGLLSIPLIMVTHAAGVAEAGRFAVAQNLLMIVAVGLSPLSIVLLPYVSERLAKDDFSSIKSNSVLLFHAIADISLYFALHVAILADIILKFWVGPKMVGATGLVRVLMIVAPFYATYFVFRSIIDATTTKPVTSLNLVAAFAIFFSGYYFLGRYHLPASLAAAFTVALAVIVLGTLSLAAMMGFYGARGFFDGATAKIALVNCALAGSLLVMRYVLGVGDAACLALEALAVLMFALSVLMVRRRWALSLLGHFGFSEGIKHTEAAREFLAGWFRRLGTSAE